MMTLLILSAFASPAVVLTSPARSMKYEARPGTQVLRIGSYIYDGTDPKNPILLERNAQFVDANVFLRKFVSKNKLEEPMQEARKWVANEFYNNERPTLAALRLKAGLTQADLASATQQPQSSVSRLESGSEMPSLERAKKFASALDVTLDQYYEALRATRAEKEHG